MNSRPYADEEILSLDRIKRASMGRIIEVAEVSLEQGAPFDREKLVELTEKEWGSVKAAVKSSPAAREKAREYLRLKVSEMLDDQIGKDRAELESLGVQEKSI